MEIDNDTSHPNPQPSTHHRKIELQSPLDLLYLQENLANIARSKLDLHFPPIPTASKPATIIALGRTTQDGAKSTEQLQPPPEPETEPDPLRAKVHSYISDFLHTTWSTAQPNLTLNGLDVSTTTTPISASAILSTAPEQTTQPLDHNSTSITNGNSSNSEKVIQQEIEGKHFTYTPFDPRLQHRVASLYADLERLTAEVSKLRREAPRSGARKFESAFTETITKDEKMFVEQDKDEEEEEVDFDVEKNATVRDGWADDVKSHYEGAVRRLNALAGVSGTDSGVIGIDEHGLAAGNGRKRPISSLDTSLTETMGKVQRARTVALEME